MAHLENTTTITFHLRTLEKAGLLEGKYTAKDKKRGVIAIKGYNLTAQGHKVLDYINSFNMG